MTAEERAEHEQRRKMHFGKVIKDGAIYAQPFSEGSAAAAGKAPFGTTAARAEGGWRINGRKIFASLSGAAHYYGVLCTEAKPDLSMKDTLYLAIPGNAAGLSITGDWDPLGMRGTVSRTLVFKDVFVPDEAQMMPRGVYFQRLAAWKYTPRPPTWASRSPRMNSRSAICAATSRVFP